MRRNQKRENTSELAKLRHYDYKNYDILKKKQSKFEPEDRHCLDNVTTLANGNTPNSRNSSDTSRYRRSGPEF
jgi:hypothetical protein